MEPWRDIDGRPVATLFLLSQETAPRFGVVHVNHFAPFRVRYPRGNYRDGGSWSVEFWSGVDPSAGQAWLWCGDCAFADLVPDRTEFPDADFLATISPDRAVLSCGHNRAVARGIVRICVNECRDFLFSVSPAGLLFQLEPRAGAPVFSLRPGVPRLPSG